MPVLRAAWAGWICKVLVARWGRRVELSAPRAVYKLDSYGRPPRARAADGRKVAEQDPLIRAIPWTPPHGGVFFCEPPARERGIMPVRAHPSGDAMTPPLSTRLRATPGAASLALALIAAGFLSGAAAAWAVPAQDELEWARDALARNATLDVVSSDPSTGIITVRVKSTGELRQVSADDVVAALPASAEASASDSTTPGAPSPTPGAPSTPSGAPAGARVIASGPGYSIAAVGPAQAGAPVTGESSAAEDAGPARNLPLERRHEPLICQGARLLHIDSRNLVFDGDAVSVEQGCELHITNSLITASGVGITARGASVHIDNSIVAGSAGSIDASDGAQVYARSSTFKGLIRRNDTAAFHDLGGNVGN